MFQVGQCCVSCDGDCILRGPVCPVSKLVWIKWWSQVCFDVKDQFLKAFLFSPVWVLLACTQVVRNWLLGNRDDGGYLSEDPSELISTCLESFAWYSIRSSSLPWVNWPQHTPHFLFLQCECVGGKGLRGRWHWSRPINLKAREETASEASACTELLLLLPVMVGDVLNSLPQYLCLPGASF